MPVLPLTLPALLAIAWAAMMAFAPPAQAQACTKDTIAAVIDRTSAEIRKLNAQHHPQLQQKIRQLATQKRWQEVETNAKAAEFLQDQETVAYDEQVGQLLSDLDLLGDDTSNAQTPCAERLAKLKTVSLQLIELTTAKAAHVSARLDAEINSTRGPARTAQATQQPPAAKAPPPPAAGSEPKSTAPPPPAEKPIARVAPQPAAPPSAAPGWQTDTTQQHQQHPQRPPGQVAELEVPPAAGSVPYAPIPNDESFSVEEIRATGSGFFGTISSSLASVIEHAFRSYGRPNGYILGSEGGGALIAGLRYGEGRLVTKAGGERRVFWQGPSFGYDLGVDGSRVMFLVYNMRDHEELFARFAGVDGAAYLVGGVGITFLKKGPLILAPIRTGLGLRVGANVGYLKFTPQPSLNPF